MTKHRVTWMVEHIIHVDAPDEKTAIDTAQWYSYRHAHITETSTCTVTGLPPDAKCDITTAELEREKRQDVEAVTDQ